MQYRIIKKNTVKPICFYLPSYYPNADNDMFWGKNWIEWHNIFNANKKFASHDQPRKPLFGQYDLTNKFVRKWQGELAKKHKIYGFCYYHYYSNGRFLLEKPMELMLTDGYPNIKFCFSWANENWTSIWNGQNDHILMQQTYGNYQDWVNHYNYLLKFFKHKNYILVNNKPLFLIYRMDNPIVNNIISVWRELSKQNGFDGMYILGTLGWFDKEYESNIDVDGMVEYQPGFAIHCHVIDYVQLKLDVFTKYSADELWDNISLVPRKHPVQYKGLFSGFDNTPRRKNMNADIFDINNVEKFENCFCNLKKITLNDKSLHDNFIFINAWNEWGEGSYLEPDEKYKYKYLEMIKDNI